MSDPFNLDVIDDALQQLDTDTLPPTVASTSVEGVSARPAAVALDQPVIPQPRPAWPRPILIPYLVGLVGRRGRGVSVFDFDASVPNPYKVLDSAIRFFRWGPTRADTERKLMQADIAAIQADQPNLSIRPSSLAFFRRRWRNDEGLRFIVDDSLTVHEAFERLTRFVHWSRKAVARNRRVLCEELSDRIDNGLEHVEQMRRLIRRYSRINGRERWAKEYIDQLTRAKCKQLIQDELNINIWDYIEGSTRQFGSYNKLKSYTLANSRCFPVDEAKAERSTRLLLKVFFGTAAPRAQSMPASVPKKAAGGEDEPSVTLQQPILSL